MTIKLTIFNKMRFTAMLDCILNTQFFAIVLISVDFLKKKLNLVIRG